MTTLPDETLAALARATGVDLADVASVAGALAGAGLLAPAAPEHDAVAAADRRARSAPATAARMAGVVPPPDAAPRVIARMLRAGSTDAGLALLDACGHPVDAVLAARLVRPDLVPEPGGYGDPARAATTLAGLLSGRLTPQAAQARAVVHLRASAPDDATVDDLLVAVETLTLCGDAEGALSFGGQLAAEADAAGSPAWQAYAELQRATAAFALGHARLALELTAHAGELLEPAEWGLAVAGLHAVTVDAWTALEHPERAAAALRSPLPPDALRTRGGLAYLGARSRHLRAVRRPREAARDQWAVRDLGRRWRLVLPCEPAVAVPPARVAAAVPPDRARAVAAVATAGQVLTSALSPAEQRVVEQAARGRTNRQIARQLSITESTVEQHLTRCYRKLRVSSRAELRSLGCA